MIFISKAQFFDFIDDIRFTFDLERWGKISGTLSQCLLLSEFLTMLNPELTILINSTGSGKNCSSKFTSEDQLFAGKIIGFKNTRNITQEFKFKIL